jgi:hypothetical protein
MTTSGEGPRRITWVATALALYILARVLSPAQGLTASGQAVLGTVICGMALWMSEAAPLSRVRDWRRALENCS